MFGTLGIIIVGILVVFAVIIGAAMFMAGFEKGLNMTDDEYEKYLKNKKTRKRKNRIFNNEFTELSDINDQLSEISEKIRQK